jgi:hypothetical protein
MQFSDTTSKDGILQRIEFNVGLPDGAITSDSTLLARVTALVNDVYDHVGILIWMASKGWDIADYNATTTPYANQALTTARHVLIDDASSPTIRLMKIKRVDITYDGTTWYKADPIDTATMSFGMGDADEVDEHFTNTEPKYRAIGNMIEVYPRATSAQVSAGAEIRVEYTPAFSHFATSDTTKTLGFDSVLNGLVPAIASMRYAVINDLKRQKSLKILVDEQIAMLRAYFGTKNDEAMPVATSSAWTHDYS